MSIGVMTLIRLDVDNEEQAEAVLEEIFGCKSIERDDKGCPLDIDPFPKPTHSAVIFYEIEDML